MIFHKTVIIMISRLEIQLQSVFILSRVRLCLILLFTHRVCLCEPLFGKTYRLKGTLEGTTCQSSHTTLSFDARSAIICLNQCSIKADSISTFYNQLNDVCKCCSELYATSAGLPTDTGSNYYIIAPDPVCSNYLVDEVDDSQLTQSGFFCQFFDCVGFDPELSPTDTSAIHARLNSTGHWTGAWTAPHNTTVADYVQVDFRNLKTIAAVALLGRDAAPELDGGALVNQYVTSFKVLTSDDCKVFTYISDGAVDELIFQGNSVTDELVVRYLPDRVISRCVRIKPVEYYGIDKSLRFDVLGC